MSRRRNLEMAGQAVTHLVLVAICLKELDQARDTCRDWYPEIYQELTGDTPTPETSTVLAERKFHADNANNWVVVGAQGDWKAGVPKGYCECIATLAGTHNLHDQTRTYHITSERYHVREQFGYVIQSDDLRVS